MTRKPRFFILNIKFKKYFVPGLLTAFSFTFVGCQQARYNSQLKAMQACTAWALEAKGRVKLTYPKGAANSKMEHINRLIDPRYCQDETTTRQVIGLEYKGKIESNSLLEHKASKHYRY